MALRVNRLVDHLPLKLRARRDEFHLSQGEAAAIVGVSTRTWQNWEAGAKLPQPKHRRALETFLTEDPQVAA